MSISLTVVRILETHYQTQFTDKNNRSHSKINLNENVPFNVQYFSKERESVKRKCKVNNAYNEEVGVGEDKGKNSNGIHPFIQ